MKLSKEGGPRGDFCSGFGVYAEVLERQLELPLGLDRRGGHLELEWWAGVGN